MSSLFQRLAHVKQIARPPKYPLVVLSDSLNASYKTAKQQSNNERSILYGIPTTTLRRFKQF